MSCGCLSAAECGILKSAIVNVLGKRETQCFCFGGVFSLGIVGCRCKDTRAVPSKWEVGVK